jgi:hypothetical protein
MGSLSHAVAHCLDTLRGELHVARLDQTDLLVRAMERDLSQIAIFIVLNPQQESRFKAVRTAFDKLDQTARRAGPNIDDPQVRFAMRVAAISLDELELALVDLRPSAKAVAYGLVAQPPASIARDKAAPARGTLGTPTSF